MRRKRDRLLVDPAVQEIVEKIAERIEDRVAQLAAQVTSLQAQVDQVAAAQREFREWRAIEVANGVGGGER